MGMPNGSFLDFKIWLNLGDSPRAKVYFLLEALVLSHGFA